jgi:hypothetical protein
VRDFQREIQKIQNTNLLIYTLSKSNREVKWLNTQKWCFL